MEHIGIPISPSGLELTIATPSSGNGFNNSSSSSADGMKLILTHLFRASQQKDLSSVLSGSINDVLSSSRRYGLILEHLHHIFVGRVTDCCNLL
jgi:hypothetical protein